MRLIFKRRQGLCSDVRKTMLGSFQNGCQHVACDVMYVSAGLSKKIALALYFKKDENRKLCSVLSYHAHLRGLVISKQAYTCFDLEEFI